MSTAKIAEPIAGDKLYQERARAALPLLVRQAEAGVPIFYSDLARELGMKNPRNLNYVLGSIGQTLERLSKTWKQKVPPIQCLVLNKSTGLPGEGIGWFLLKEEDFSTLSRRQQRTVVEAELNHVFTFPRWREALKTLSLKETHADFSAIVNKAARLGSSGESEDHRRLKEFVARTPEAIGLSKRTEKGTTEFSLPSGDFLDVSFQDQGDWVAAEVKSVISDDADIARGLFQCIKYRAVMEAVQLSNEAPQNSRAVLVLGGKLPAKLVALKNLLGIEVFEEIEPS